MGEGFRGQFALRLAINQANPHDANSNPKKQKKPSDEFLNVNEVDDRRKRFERRLIRCF